MSADNLTREQLLELATLAIQVALEAPFAQRNKYSTAAYVPWSLVHEIREKADAARIPWREHHRDAEKRKAKAHA